MEQEIMTMLLKGLLDNGEIRYCDNPHEDRLMFDTNGTRVEAWIPKDLSRKIRIFVSGKTNQEVIDTVNTDCEAIIASRIESAISLYRSMENTFGLFSLSAVDKEDICLQ